MKNFNRGGDRFGDRKGRGFKRRDSGGRGFSRRDDSGGRPTMHKAICDECGQSCEVPFKPSGDKPIYCSNCFKGKENSGGNRSSRDFGKGNFREKKMFSAVCDACGQSCEVPFRPTGEKPVYCNDCFGLDTKTSEKKVSSESSTKQFDHQLQIINEKLDMILQSLPIAASKAPAVKKEKVVKEKKEIAKVETKKKTTKVAKAKAKTKKK